MRCSLAAVRVSESPYSLSALCPMKSQCRSRINRLITKIAATVGFVGALACIAVVAIGGAFPAYKHGASIVAPRTGDVWQVGELHTVQWCVEFISPPLRGLNVDCLIMEGLWSGCRQPQRRERMSLPCSFCHTLGDPRIRMSFSHVPVSPHTHRPCVFSLRRLVRSYGLGSDLGQAGERHGPFCPNQRRLLPIQCVQFYPMAQG